MANQSDAEKAKIAADEQARKAEAKAKREEKPEEPMLSADEPYPTQADLDAMRAGNYRNRELKAR